MTLMNSFHPDVSDDDELGLALCKVIPKSIRNDGIPILFIKLIFAYFNRFLIFHTDSILTSWKFPSVWKVARALPIPRYKIVNSLDVLRPISILPAFSGVVGHIPKDQVLFFVRGNISPSQ